MTSQHSISVASLDVRSSRKSLDQALWRNRNRLVLNPRSFGLGILFKTVHLNNWRRWRKTRLRQSLAKSVVGPNDASGGAAGSLGCVSPAAFGLAHRTMEMALHFCGGSSKLRGGDKGQSEGGAGFMRQGCAIWVSVQKITISAHQNKSLYWMDFSWCCRRDSNSRPLHYQWSALPLSYGSQ